MEITIKPNNLIMTSDLRVDLRSYVSDKPYLKEFTDAMNEHCSFKVYDTINCPEVLSIFEKNHDANGTLITDFSLFKCSSFWKGFNDIKEYFLILLDAERCASVTKLMCSILEYIEVSQINDNIFGMYKNYTLSQLKTLECLAQNRPKRTTIFIYTFNCKIPADDRKYITDETITDYITKNVVNTQDILDGIMRRKEFLKKCKYGDEYELLKVGYNNLQEAYAKSQENYADDIAKHCENETRLANELTKATDMIEILSAEKCIHINEIADLKKKLADYEARFADLNKLIGNITTFWT